MTNECSLKKTRQIWEMHMTFISIYSDMLFNDNYQDRASLVKNFMNVCTAFAE